MMKRKKIAAIFGLAAVLALSAAVTQPGVDASAAVKEVPLSTAIDDVYWTRQGDDSVYSQNEKQPVFKNDSGFTYISTCDTMKGDRSVYVEFNVVSFTYDNGTQFLFQPYSESMEGTTEVLYTTGEKSTGQHTGTGNYNDWNDDIFAFGSAWGAGMVAYNNPFWGYDEQYVTKVRYVGRTDGSVSLYIYEQDIANRTENYVWTEKYRTHAADGSGKNYFAAPEAEKNYHILFAVNGAVEISGFAFGTIEESAEDLAAHTMTDKTVLTELVGTENVGDGTVQTSDREASGKIFATQGRVLVYGETIVTNPTKNDMLVTAMEVYKDDIATKVFSLDTTLQIPTLSEGRKVGVGIVQMGADGITADTVDASGSSYIYFESKGGKNYLGLMNGGVFVREYEVGDISETFELNILAYRDDTVSVTVAGTEYTFEGVTVEGYLAFASLGSGDAEYLIGMDVDIIRYAYTSSDGAVMECNFDEWMNPQDFFIDTRSTAGFANPEEAVGVELADGAVFFNGSGTNSVFSPIGMYADFVFEFDYTSFAIEDRPEKAAGWLYGYSDMTIAFGNETPYGWGQGAYQIFIRDYSTRQWNTPDEPYQGYGSVKLANWMDGGATIGEEIFISEGTDTVDAEGNHTYTSTANEGYLSLYNATTKIKLVVADNVATLYGCTMTEGKALSEYTADDYIEIGRWELPEALSGRVSVCADENAYFKIDNVRITPLDGDEEGDVAKNLAAYVDFKEIATEARPAQLASPVLSLDGNVVSWDAIDGAVGYVVSVNGGEDIEVKGTSYTVEATEDGSYEIAVKAVGDGDKLLDSNYARITYVKGGTDTDSSASGGTSSGASAGGSSSGPAGCGSAFGWAVLPAAALCLAAVSAKKRKD